MNLRSRPDIDEDYGKLSWPNPTPTPGPNPTPTPTPTPCPADWMGTDGGDFCYLVSRGPMNWFSAQEVNISLANTTFIISSNITWYVTTILFFNNYQFCWNNGGYLAEFFSSQEEARVEDILATDLDYWIGLTDRQTEGMKRKGKIKTNKIFRCLEVAGKSY